MTWIFSGLWLVSCCYSYDLIGWYGSSNTLYASCTECHTKKWESLHFDQFEGYCLARPFIARVFERILQNWRVLPKTVLRWRVTRIHWSRIDIAVHFSLNGVQSVKFLHRTWLRLKPAKQRCKQLFCPNKILNHSNLFKWN